MAAGKRLDGESEMTYKRRLKTEAAEEKRAKRVKAALPPGSVTIEERITQVYEQMASSVDRMDIEQVMLTMISYTAHLEARVVDLEGQMTNLLASLKMAAELERSGKAEILKPLTEIIIP